MREIIANMLDIAPPEAIVRQHFFCMEAFMQVHPNAKVQVIGVVRIQTET